MGHRPDAYTYRQAAASLSELTANIISSHTIAAYRRSWGKLDDFTRAAGLGGPIPVPVSTLRFFVGHLHARGFAAASIATHVAAISFVHKILGWDDPAQDFHLRAVMKSVRRSVVPDTRSPISQPSLQALIRHCYRVYGMHYEFLLFRCLFSFAFYGFCRIGELVQSSGADHRLRFEDVSIANDEVQLRFRSFKHSTGEGKAVLKRTGSVCCPVRAAEEYLLRRPTSSASRPFFISVNGSDICRPQVVVRLKEWAGAVGLGGRVDGHSFRIGATCHAAAQGRSDAELRMLGRWKSDAFRVYLRGAVSL